MKKTLPNGKKKAQPSNTLLILSAANQQKTSAGANALNSY